MCPGWIIFAFISTLFSRRIQMYNNLQTYLIATRKMRLGGQKVVVFAFLSPSWPTFVNVLKMVVCIVKIRGYRVSYKINLLLS